LKNRHLIHKKYNHSFFKLSTSIQKIIFGLLILFCLSGYVSPPIALLLGLLVANLSGHPFLQYNYKITNVLLQFSVVGLGFGMNINAAMSAGKQGFLFTILSIFCTLILGFFLGKWLDIEKKTSHLISCGTAICGGSAIAAIAPVIESNEKQTSVALGVIFILNSIALFLFPAIGHWLEMSQQQFGLWCAIAIHDTSSVVGAANKYGAEALQIATTVKLARALWIVPVALLTSFIFKNKSARIKIPYFIGLFILAMLLNTYVLQVALISPFLVTIAKIGLTLTLFLIGAGLNFTALKSVGFKPLFQGFLLWLFISTAALYSILYFT
jgi:uncharacterized integral membrane protein (TIGR00698 family)